MWGSDFPCLEIKFSCINVTFMIIKLYIDLTPNVFKIEYTSEKNSISFTEFEIQPIPMLES